MKPGVAIQILGSRVSALQDGELLLIHIGSEDPCGERKPFHLQNFDAGLAHGYILVAHEGTARVCESWIDLTGLGNFSIDQVTTLDALKVACQTWNKEAEEQRKHGNPLQQLMAQMERANHEGPLS